VWKAEPAPPSPSGRPPLTILAAMGIAIGGAAVSSAFFFWIGRQYPVYLSALTLYYLLPHLIGLALNIWFLIGMWHQAEWAWRAAFTLVAIGAVFDFFAFALPVVLYLLLYSTYDLVYLGGLLAPNANNSFAQFTIGAWIHLVVIQVPILVLLWRTSSRRWVGIETPGDGLQDRISRS
jgi:hypothetical protein